jgi:purine catabolism regulator
MVVGALDGAAHSRARPWHDATRPDLDRLLWSLREHPDMRTFVERSLGALVERDQARNLELMPTLAAYCARGGSKAQTARDLHIERQSLYNRLSRIENVLGTDLSDPENLATLYLALRARAHVSPGAGTRLSS